MAKQTIDVQLTWEDVSTGSAEETGQEIEIYTDSPSFVPTIPINYNEARHAWMRLPPIAAGEESAIVELRTPVTFVEFRVRQYNDEGPGQWSLAKQISVQQSSGPNAPGSPINLGAVVVTGGTPPPPPIDPPPPPPPTGGGGTSSNYTYTSQFSGVQGQNQWSYKDSSGANLTYSSANAKWDGNETYLAIWNGGFRHSADGLIKDAVLRWTAPASGVALVSGTAGLFTAPGSVRFVAKHNTTTKFTQDMTDATLYPYSFSATVSAGDTIDFISQRIGTSLYNNNSKLDPVINFTTDGSTPANPTISSVLPATSTIAFGGSQSLTVALSSAPSAPVSVVMSSSDITKVFVPSTLIIPAGQTSALVTVTAISSGASTITATYNGSSKAAVITVGNPISGSWPNAPIGGTVLVDHAWNTVSPLISQYNNTGIVTDATAPLSPSSVGRHRIEALAGTGGDETYYRAPIYYRELYLGCYWRMNPQFQGRRVPNKVWFIQSDGYTQTFFGVYGGPNTGQPNFYLAAGPNSQVDNSHLFNGDPIGNCYPNTGANATVVPGVWYQVESSIIASTTQTARDGRLRMWLNGVLIVDYPNFNMCGPQGQAFNKVNWNETWDGAQDMGISNTVAWEHYMDHWYIVGKN